jgi:hypothetical protein
LGLYLSVVLISLQNDEFVRYPADRSGVCPSVTITPFGTHRTLIRASFVQSLKLKTVVCGLLL